MATPRSRKTSGSSHSRNGAKAGPRSTAAGARAAQEQLKQAVQQVWLAGMGALARAQKEGLQTGTTAQRRMRDVLGAAQETLQTRVGDAREQAQEAWDSLEALFQSRVQRAMHQLGVPTAAEIRELSRRVAELNDAVVGTRKPARRAKGAAKRKTSGPARAKTAAPAGRRARTAAKSPRRAQAKRTRTTS